MSGDFGLSPKAEKNMLLREQHTFQARAKMAGEIFQWIVENKAELPQEPIDKLIKILRFR